MPVALKYVNVSSDEGGEVMRTIAIVNQKGGCGKTTTAINLSACLAQKHKKVLLVDLDPQSNASIGLKVKVEDLDRSIYDIFSQSHDLEDVIIPIDQYLHLVPSQLILSAVEQELAGKEGREGVLLRTMDSDEKGLSLHYCRLSPQFRSPNLQCTKSLQGSTDTNRDECFFFTGRCQIAGGHRGP